MVTEFHFISTRRSPPHSLSIPSSTQDYRS